MPKIKVAKSAPSLDMTPMVDLAFLLVTFFMLAASFRTAEPVIVDPPASHSDKLLPENTIMVTVDNIGRPFFTLTNAEARMNALKRMAERYKVPFTEKQVKTFGGLSSIGVDIKDLPKYIDLDEAGRKKFQPQKGIPTDSTNNQLHDWILYAAQEANVVYKRAKDEAIAAGKEFKGEKLRYAIKADGKVKYISVKKVIDEFTNLKIYQLNFITSLEGGEKKAEEKK